MQPDSSVPDDGMYDALALTDNASLADVFIVSFVWQGSGTPGSQYFEVYDPDYVVLDSESGQTSQVPVPSALLLLGSGLAGLAGFKFRKRRTV